jgi:hypothetical protein
LLPLAARLGEVRDELGQTVGGAIVTCTEVGFAGRSWSATTDPAGQFILTAPSTASSCTVTPPSDREDLALTRQPIDAELAMDGAARWNLTARPGSLVSGVVNVRGSATLEAPPVRTLPGAVVEVRDAAGYLLGIAISDEDGRFSIRVAE